MSRKTNSSAPCWSYCSASSTGSPASRRSTKFTPFTTRPAVTSRHGIILLASIDRSEISKVLQHLPADRAGFFGMELNRNDVLALERGREKHASVCASGGGGVLDGCVVAVSKVDVGLGRQSFEQLRFRRLSSGLDLIPAHVRHAHVTLKLPDAASKQAESQYLRRFLATLEKRLQAKADAKERN